VIWVTALSYLLAGYVGAVVLVFFGLRILRSVRALDALPGQQWPESGSTVPLVGGLGVVVPVLGYVFLLAAEGLGWARALLVGCSLLVLLGLWDDIKVLRVDLRLALQFLAVAVVVAFMEFSGVPSQWHWLTGLLLTGAVLWQVNLFNSMIGLDAVVAIQSGLFCVAINVLTLDIPGWVGDLTWLLAGSLLGFLVYNWPPAKISMGRTGRGFLGLLLAVIVLQLWRDAVLPPVASLILLAGLWFDGAYRLCIRMLTGQGVSAALFPRSGRGDCLYAKMAEWRGQLWTIVVCVVYFICWLLPLAGLSIFYVRFELIMLALAVLPLGIAATRLKPKTAVPEEG
jgi:Fuc2NAc and GlcNAc transferase